MITRNILRSLTMGLACGLVLAGCGGGGGGGAAEPPKSFTVTVGAQDTTLSANDGGVTFEPNTDFATQVNISVRDASGQAVPAGTPVTVSVSNPEIGLLSSVDTLLSKMASIQVTTGGGGNASVVFHALREGSTQVVATAFDANANRNVSSSVTITVDNSVEAPRRVDLSATRITLPANSFGVQPFFGSPFISEVTITYRDELGNLSSPLDAEAGVSITPVTIAAFSTLDDGETDDVNEFFVLLGNGPVEFAGGSATVFVHSFDIPGTATLRVSAQGNDGQTFDDELTITVTEPAADGAPANVAVIPATPNFYIQGSGGLINQQVQIQVVDGAFEPVSDPTGNNILVEIFTESPNSGEQLSAVNANGTQVTGTSIAVPTTAGVTSVNLRAGTQPGFIRIRATADAADNNVDNGIQVPIRDEFVVEVSDGVPFAITLDAVPADSPTAVDPNPNAPFPLTSNSVLSVLVEAVVTDRQGNPPAQPVTVRFGLLDFPTSDFPTAGPGVFALSGSDGDPEEGGTDFFAPTGQFVTAGGGAGPGDTLVLFGREVEGNADHESARTVAQIIDQDSLIVDEPFNRNNTTGVQVDSGPVIPYAIGRAMFGNIETGVLTNADGVASTFINYPISSVGRSLIIYAQGTNGPLTGSGNFHTFADVALTVYPPAGQLSLFASPTAIPANTTTSVEVCAIDATGVPVPGVFIDFAVDNPVGTASIDGNGAQGTLDNPTGFDGCTIARVTTSGIPAGTDDFMITFAAGGATATVDVRATDDAILTVQPSTILGDNLLGREVIIRYVDSNGNGIEGVRITGVCESDIGAVNLLEEPGVTDENGETTAVVTISELDAICPEDQPGEGECVFTTAAGDPEAILTVRGRDASALFSPSIFCEGEDEEMPGGTLSAQFEESNPGNNAGAAGGAQIISGDGQINCAYDLAGGPMQGGDCNETYDETTTVTLSLSFSNLPTGETPQDQRCAVNNREGCFLRWEGACSAANDNLSASVEVAADVTCIARFR